MIGSMRCLAGILPLAFAALVVGCRKSDCTTCAAPEADMRGRKSEEPEINTEGLAALRRAGVKMALLDARGGMADTRIPGARPLTANASAEEAAAAGGRKDALVVTYCGGLTCPASRMLARRLRELGYVNVIEYPWGIEGWTKAGQPVEKAASARM